MKIDSEIDIDAKLLELIEGGDEAAFSKLVKRWYKRLYNYAYRYGNSKLFAEEVVQKTFIQVHRKLNYLDDYRKFKPWIYTVANNLCITEGRSVKRNNDRVVQMDMVPDQKDILHPQAIYLKQERKNLINQALQKLTADQRQVIIMKEYDGLKFREIAEILGEAESTVKSRLYYGLDALKKIIKKQPWTKELYYE